MKIAIYTPYLDSFGGGERYMLTIAEVLSKENEVDLLLDQHHLTLEPETLIPKLSEHLALDLSKVNITKVPMGKGFNSIRRLLFFYRYDLLTCLTDGSIFYSTAKKSLLHFQVPFKNTAAKSLWGKIKLASWNLAICNSKFTESYINKDWPIKTSVLYPPVEIEKIRPLKKEKYILSVGRFFSFLKSKKHEDMIKAFRSLHESGRIKGWSLHLAGSLEGDEEYINELKELAKSLPVTFYPNLAFNDLLELYGKSSIYWHAAGFGEEDPAKMEHFGITTVEAMAAKCVPVVINRGGQTEIVEDGKNGFLWDDLEKLQKDTLKLIEDEKLRDLMGEEALRKSRMFSKTEFAKQIIELVRSH